MRVVLGVTGGIAAYKAALLLRLLTESGHEVTVVPTEAALRFVGAPTWEALSGRAVQTDVWTGITDVPHVRIGQEADLVVVAPATADLLARAAHGLAGDLLTNVLLTARCPVVMAPAMHTEMWQHAATQANVATLRERGVVVVEPDSGRLTGADTGPGRLPEPEAIHDAALAALQSDRRTGDVAVAGQGDLAGRRVLISTGGTREPLDPVRYLGNRSTGKQGVALAEAARDLGAHVHLIAANIEVPAPEGVRVTRVERALELREVVLEASASADVLVMSAAVADFRPAEFAEFKIKKSADSEDAPVINLVRNPDILREVVVRRAQAREAGQTCMGPQIIVGFAAETGSAEKTPLELGREKMQRKGADFLAVNTVGVNLGFGTDENTITLLSALTDEEPVLIGSKKDVSVRLLEYVSGFFGPDCS